MKKILIILGIAIWIGISLYAQPIPFPVTPDGNDSQVQFNNGGVFGGDSTFTFNDSTKVVSMTGAIINGTIATGLDMSGGTFATAVQNWPATPVINVAGVRTIKFDNTNGNTLIGKETCNTSNGSSNTALGDWAGRWNSTSGGGYNGTNNTYIGYRSGVGWTAPYANTGYWNVGVGGSTLYRNTSGYANMAIGVNSLFSNTSGYANSGIGFQSLLSNTIGHNNCGIGASSLSANTTGTRNVGIGTYTLASNTVGYDNLACGTHSMNDNTCGHSNTGVGWGSLWTMKPTGKAITIFADSSTSPGTKTTVTSAGHGQLDGATIQILGTTSYDGSYVISNKTTDTFDIVKVFVANDATGWWWIESEAKCNTVLGKQAGRNFTTGSSNIFLGFQSGYNQTTNSNLLIIDNQNRTSAALEITNSLIYGIFAAAPANQSLRINGEILGSDGAKIGDGGTTNYANIGTNGDLSFAGSAGFYPRRLSQNDVPASGTGATQIDTGELLVWRDANDTTTFLMFNDPNNGVVKVQLN